MFLGSPHPRGIAAAIHLVVDGSANKRRYDREPARRAKTIRVASDSAPATSFPSRPSSREPNAPPYLPRPLGTRLGGPDVAPARSHPILGRQCLYTGQHLDVL